MPPLISICLPNLNTRPFLDERMATILAQTIKDWELIICDSYSDDGAWEFFQKFAGDPRIRLHQVPRAGIYGGFNDCLRRATGKYCYIATSDDTMRPDCLEKLLSPLEQIPAIKLAYCDYEKIDARGKPVAIEKDWRREFLGHWMDTTSIHRSQTEFILHCALNITWVTITSILFRRDLLDRIGLFRTDCGSAGDLEFALRAALATDIAYVPGKLSAWRVHDQQGTPKFFEWEFMGKVLGMFQAVLYDPQAGVPEEWMKIQDWDKELTAVWEMEYQDSFHLDRGYARRQPGKFLRNAWAALWRRPGLLLSQTARGFAWSKRFSPNRVEAAKRMFALFQPPWPPENVSFE